jgi:hypothetical protein
MTMTWTDSLQQLERDVKQLEKQRDSAPQVQMFEVVEAERRKLAATLKTFGIAHDRIMKLARKRNPQLSKAGETVLYWSRQYLMTTRQLVEEFMALQHRKMWLRLLQARFTHNLGDEKATLETKQLVELVERRRQLAAVEDSLTAQLELVRARREQLKIRYEAIGAADENWRASGSMATRLGINVRDSKHHPAAIGLKDLFTTLSVPLRHPTDLQTLKHDDLEIGKSSDFLLLQCNQIARDFVAKGQSAIDGEKVEEFKLSMQRVENLSEHQFQYWKSLTKERVGPCQPRVFTNPIRTGIRP